LISMPVWAAGLNLVMAGALQGQAAARDSGSVRIAENVASRSAPLLVAGPTLVLADDDEAAFTLIVSARVMPDGDLAIVDLHDRSFRVFDGETGDFEGRIGRAGQGPEEFSAAPSIAVGADGSVREWDPGNRRMSLWGPGGELVSSENIAGRGSQGLTNAFTPGSWQVAPSGLALARGVHQVRGPSGWTETHTIHLFGEGLDEPRRVGPELPSPKAWVGDLALGSPFDLGRRSTLRGNKVVASHESGAWQLDVFDREGKLVEIIRAPIARRPLSPALVAREREAIEGAFEPRVLDELFDAVARVDSTSAIGGVFADHAGTVWV
jgi:hypothetical protein